MNNRIYIKPMDGLLVIDPTTGRDMPAAGAWVPNNRHWRRMLAAGDVVAGKPRSDQRKAKQGTETKQSDEAEQ